MATTGTSSSLVVKISADINDFAKQLNAATREVDRASRKITDIGKTMTLAITAPFVALGAALSKAAADDEASIKKLEHTFGQSASNMEGFIKNLMKTVPETDDALRQLTSSTDVFLRSLGFGVPKAVEMTKAVSTLAGDLAAFNHVSLETAQSALQSGLAGQTRGLKEFLINISETDIKTRAYKMGLAEVGDELSHTATAQAAWALILEKSKVQQGEAARTINDDANALARLRQSADAVADSFGKVFLPIAAKVVGVTSDILRGMDELSPTTKNWVVAIGGIAAAVGPAIVIVGSLTESIFRLSKALTALGTGSALAGLTRLGSIGVIAGLITLPVLATILAFDKQGEAARRASADLDTYKAALDKLTAAQIRTQLSATQGMIGTLIGQRETNKTAVNAAAPGTNLDQFIQKGNQLQAQIVALQGQADALNAKLKELGLAPGGGGGEGGETDLEKSLKHIDERAKLITESIKQMQDGWVQMPKIADAWADALRRVEAIAKRFGDSLDPIAVKARGIAQDLRSAMGLGTPLPGVPNKLPILPDMPLRNTMIGDVVPQKLDLSPLDSLPPIPQKLDMLHQALAAGFNQVSIAIGDTLASRLAGQFGGKGTGSAIGAQLGSAFGTGIGGGLFAAGAFGSGVLATGIAGLATGGLAVAALGVGSLIGGLFDHHKKSVDDSANAFDRLNKTIDKVTASITNVPQFFKIEAYRFESAPAFPRPVTGGTGTTGSTGTTGPIGTPPPDPNDGHRGGASANIVIHNLNLPSVQNARDFIQQLADLNLRRQATGAAGTFAFSGGSTP